MRNFSTTFNDHWPGVVSKKMAKLNDVLEFCVRVASENGGKRRKRWVLKVLRVLIVVFYFVV